MKRNYLTRYGGWLVVLLLLVVLQPVSNMVNRDRLIHGLSRPMPVTRLVEKDFLVVPGIVAGAILGGFREVAASMLWMKADEVWDKGEGTELKFLSLARTTTLLDPHWIEPWRITGWHLAYNLFVETKDPDLRAKYLQMAVDCLKEGISWNPDTYDLYYELGWTYYDKIRDYDQAAMWLGHAIEYPHPEHIERLIAHAYERQPQMQKALDWYDYCIKRNPADATAHGGTLTIHERYLRAWRLCGAGQYDAALKEANDYIAVAPNNILALHLKAYIFEKAGRLRDAYDTWMLSAQVYGADAHARAQAARLGARLNLPIPPEPTYLFEKQLAVPQKTE